MSDGERALRVQVAKLEASRGAGVAQLVELLHRSAGDRLARTLALRALARIGGAQAEQDITQAIAGDDPAPAIAALGILAALADDPGGEPSPGAADASAARTTALIAAGRAHPELAPVVAEALGRAGNASALPILTEWIASGRPADATAAGIALGRFGRRKLALTEPVRGALIAASRAADRDTRYAATYALRQEVVDGRGSLAAGRAGEGQRGGIDAKKLAAEPSDPVADALVARAADDDPEIRALTVAGLGKRGAANRARAAIEHALLDRDGRVAVEAVRALTSEQAGDASLAAVAATAARALAALATEPARIQVATEALRDLAQPHTPAPVLAAIAAITPPPAAPPIIRGWIACLVANARARAGALALTEVERCGNGELADGWRLPLVAELVVAGAASDPAVARAALAPLLAHPDPRVAAASLTALASLAKTAGAGERRSAIEVATTAIASGNALVAGAAVDALADLTANASAAERAPLDAAIAARAARETDAELAGSLLEAIGTRKIVAGADACRHAATGAPVIARSARKCLSGLGEPIAAPAEVAAAPLPPVDPATVIGADVVWKLATSRGDVAIELDPDVAPWAVAAIVALTRSGFYDGHAMHRVVPDFVVQGGDPTESGAGGPTYSLPAEPAVDSDGPGYREGGVGMADAGPDSAGSQWFIMHTRAPHLDGRYTWVGHVVSGQNVADSLVIGDVVVHASVEVTPR